MLHIVLLHVSGARSKIVNAADGLLPDELCGQKRLHVLHLPLIRTFTSLPSLIHSAACEAASP